MTTSFLPPTSMALPAHGRGYGRGYGRGLAGLGDMRSAGTGLIFGALLAIGGLIWLASATERSNRKSRS